MITIKYTWRAKTNDPNEITGCTLVAEQVPRTGDCVMVNIPISDQQNAFGHGRVKDVIWKHRHDGQSVEVILG